MPKITLELAQSMLDRLHQIAAEKAVTVEVVVRHFLSCSLEMYEAGPGADPESFRPTKSRPMIARERIAAQVA